MQFLKGDFTRRIFPVIFSEISFLKTKSENKVSLLM